MKISIFALVSATAFTAVSSIASAQQTLSVTYSTSAAAIPTSYNLFALAQASSPQFSSGTTIGDPSSGTQSYTWVSGQAVSIKLSGAYPSGTTQTFIYQPANATLFAEVNEFDTIAIVLRSSTPSVSLSFSNITADVAFGPSASVNNLSVVGPSNGTAIDVATITGFNKGDLDQVSGTLTFVGSQVSGFDMTIYGYNTVPEPSVYSLMGVAMIAVGWLIMMKRKQDRENQCHPAVNQ